MFFVLEKPDAHGSMLEVIYHDDHLVAINKPTGLLVHRSAIDKHETRFAVQQVRDQISARVYPVHRLDKPTAGVLLFGLNADVARIVSEQFSSRCVTKHYLAVVRGHIDSSGTIDHAIGEAHDKMTDHLADSDKAAQLAITHYRRLASCELTYPVGRYATARYSLVELKPETGRRHQLRRHMKHISHHIVGDTTHGDGRQNRLFREKFNCHRLLLAATRLRITHPVTAEQLVINAGIDEQFSEILARTGMTLTPSNPITVTNTNPE